MTDVFTLRGPIKKDRPEPAKRSVTRNFLDGTALGSVSSDECRIMARGRASLSR